MTGAEVAVLGGRGKTGRAVVSALADRGARPRTIGREIVHDPVAALAGTSAVYVIAPNLYADEPDYVSAVLTAARQAGVERVVYHSVAAPYAPSMPHHLGKAEAEDVVRRSGTSWTILQPCAYVQNFVPALRAQRPVLRVPYDSSRLFGLVDLADVASAAAATLLDDGHVGATYELGGPALVSVRDVASAASAVLRVDVPVEGIGREEWARTQGAGLGERERAWLTAMFAYYDRHGLPAGSLPLRGLLGREPNDLPTTLARDLT
ncbi:MAG TPA: NmrA family NAD(P)-binding protein [Nocardioidaceae bacterium]|nr:NmrA family NAD(P)-binding protein [Nocardioidaceae bacterium]